MGKGPHLKNAPIREALIDIRVQLVEDFSVTVFSKLAEQLKEHFPNEKEIQRFQAGVQFKDGTAMARASHDASFHGVRLTSKDGTELVQFRTDGFTFNRLKPYTSWDEIFPKAFRFWQTYQKGVRPVAVSRLAVRYINSMRFPCPVTALEKYLVSPPCPPPGAQFELKSFLIHNDLFDPDSGIHVRFVQALDGIEHNSVTVLMDIDAYKLGDFGGNEQETKSVFHELREMKNRLFFESITSEAKELFNG